MAGVYVLVVLIGLMVLVSFSENKDKKTHLVFIKSFRFSSDLIAKLQKKYPNLTEEQVALVFQGLRDYFTMCFQAKGCKVAMPSRIVDETWHEFILFSRDYAGFCQNAFGYFLHHNPSPPLTSVTSSTYL
ncbi:MAG: hypothetical protein IPN42_08900 [Methylococcaceae bacterium]|nr:hypothetical protein [Methylococcaceae bacterium]